MIIKNNLSCQQSDSDDDEPVKKKLQPQVRMSPIAARGGGVAKIILVFLSQFSSQPSYCLGNEYIYMHINIPNIIS